MRRAKPTYCASAATSGSPQDVEEHLENKKHKQIDLKLYPQISNLTNEIFLTYIYFQFKTWLPRRGIIKYP